MTTIREALERAIPLLEDCQADMSAFEDPTVVNAIAELLPVARAALAAQEAQALTDEQISNVWAHECVNHHLTRELVNSFARAVERAVIAAERERCIDIVAMHGGSVEIEAAIRRGEGA